MLLEESAISRAWATGSPSTGLIKTSQMGKALAEMWLKLLA